MILKDGILLYHGSYTKVEKIDLDKCREKKDFGRGFYLTTSKGQSEKFTQTSVKKAMKSGLIPTCQDKGWVSVFKYQGNPAVKKYEFENADRKWLHCVVGHRIGAALQSEIEKWKSYDVMCGKIANDNTNLVITAYMDGLYGELFSEDADRIAISFLEPGNLRDQACFRTKESLKQLVFSDAYEVSL